jgi:hypothetical protein
MLKRGEETTLGEAKKPVVERIHDKTFSTVKNLIGKEPETLLCLERTEQGWKAIVEALERKAVPDTQDILARYELQFNEKVELLGWKQVMVRKRSDRLMQEEGR